MKKLLTIALLLIEITASAQKDSTITAIAQVTQNGIWSTGMNEADELKGTKASPYYRYDMEGMGSFILWDWEDWDFKILTEKGTFDVWYNKPKIRHYILFRMGLYTYDGKLVEKFNDALEADHIEMKSAWMNKKWTHYIYDRKKIKKMFRALKSGDGYVRIVCKRRGQPDFDLKITPYDLDK